MPAAAEQGLTRISGNFYLGDAPTLIAERGGHFTERGLSVEVEFRTGGKHKLERLRAGEIDFALLALTPLALDLWSDPTPRGRDDPVILAGLAHFARPHTTVVPSNSPVERLSDLDGRKLGLALGSGGEFAWWLAQRYRARPVAVELVDLPVEALPDALADGTVDAAVMSTPWRERFRSETGKQLRALNGSEGYTAQWVLVTRRSVSQQQPARGRAMLSAYGDAIEFIRRNPERARRQYAEHVGISADLLQHTWNPAMYGLSLDWSMISELQLRLEWARHSRGAIAGDRASVLSLLAPAPLRAHAPSAVGIPMLSDEATP